MTKRILVARNRTLDLSTPKIMGILNVTPDSFSDGGKFRDKDKAIAQAELMVKQGASIIDIGGESTRPGADPVSLEEELDRVIPVVRAVAQELDVMISVDTSAPEVMTEAVAAGAHLWNDIRALQRPQALETAAKLNVAVCLMHMQGDPKTMQNHPSYENVVTEVTNFLQERAQACEAVGIKPESIILDPGFGFGKSVQWNYELLNHLAEITKDTPYHLLSALSRKNMIGSVTNQPVAAERMVGSVVCAFYSCLNGAHMLRVHDVAETAAALAILNTINTYR